MSYIVKGKREQLEAAIIEAQRFVKVASKAVYTINQLENDSAKASCKEVAAAKRASMDLTRQLVGVRK